MRERQRTQTSSQPTFKRRETVAPIRPHGTKPVAKFLATPFQRRKTARGRYNRARKVWQRRGYNY